MKFNKDAIYAFKLNSSEELVAKVINVNETFIEISFPLTLAVGQQGLQLVPSLFSIEKEETVSINIASIVMSADPREDIKNTYIEATSGIYQGQSKQIITG